MPAYESTALNAKVIVSYCVTCRRRVTTTCRLLCLSENLQKNIFQNTLIETYEILYRADNTSPFFITTQVLNTKVLNRMSLTYVDFSTKADL